MLLGVLQINKRCRNGQTVPNKAVRLVDQTLAFVGLRVAKSDVQFVLRMGY